MIIAIRKALRLTSDAFDDEIASLILAAKLDLGISGVKNVNDADPLIQTAITTYCKAYFGLATDRGQYIDIYNNIKHHLALTTDYGGDPIV